MPPDLDEVVMRALTKAPDDRYRDAREFQKALEQYLLSTKELATSVEVSELMEMLFADRLAEERRLGAPNPSTESSTANPIPPSYNSQQSVTQPPPKPREAPPPPPPPPARPSSSAAMTMDEDAQDDGEATIGPGDDEQSQNDDDEFSIPAGTVVPSRRYVKGGATVAARAPSRVDVTRAQVEVDEPRPSKQLPRRKTGVLPEHEPGQRLPEPEEAPPPRRKSTGQLKRRTSSGAAMPEAPPRRSRPNVPVAPDEDPGHSSENISQLIDLKKMRAQQQSRLKALVAVLALVGVLILGVVFKDNILSTLRRDGLSEDGVPLRLTVTTNPPTVVTVQPPRGVKNRQPLELGRTPINEQSGAFVGDTIILENADRGIHYEQVLEYGQPNEHKLIEKEFKESTVKVRVKPQVKGATIWRGSSKLGQVNMPFSLFPGVHSLEVRSDQLVDPVPFELRFTDGQRVVEQEVDVSAALEKKQ
ncbi:MAG: hypothetical protein AMXMBFR34_45140 [Myxococcaceae bacterium]